MIKALLLLRDVLGLVLWVVIWGGVLWHNPWLLPYIAMFVAAVAGPILIMEGMLALWSYHSRRIET